ncbi:MAG: Eco57I restriction-modification methylase domain-containing protein, partial [Anaerolineae bacterium]
FPTAMAAGGFDAVIGNPPYGALFEKDEKAYIRSHYESYRYKYDSYIYFIERAVNLTKSNGWVGFITPELWLRLENCQPLRQLIAKKVGFDRIHVFGEKVFSNAVVNTVVFFLQRDTYREYLQVETVKDSWQISTASWQDNELLSIDYRLKPGVREIIDKIHANQAPLQDFGKIIQGLTPYDRYRGQDPDLIKRRGYHFDHKKNDTCGKWLRGRDIARYIQTWGGEWLSYGPWLAAPRDPSFFEGPRLLFREVPGKNKRIQATFVEETLYYGHSITPFKPTQECKMSMKYFLGLVNSYLLSWYGKLILPNFGKDTFPKLNPQDIKQLPIRTIDFDDPADVARHDEMVALVERMLALHRQLAEAKTPQAKRLLKQQIDVTDRAIDRLVYQLYGLTGDEIAIVEGAT